MNAALCAVMYSMGAVVIQNVNSSPINCLKLPMRKHIDRFLSYLEVEKNYSSHTLLNYQKDLEEFSIFLDKTPVEQVDYPVLRRFLAQIRGRNLKSRSIARNLSTLRSFFKY